MKTTYCIKGYIAHSEIDNWDQGCIGPAKTELGDRYSCEATSLRDLLDTLKAEFRVISDEDFLLDSCGEDGRLDLQVYQREPFKIGKLLEATVSNWKAGEIDLWFTCYSFQVEKVVTGFSLVDEVQE